MEEAERQISDGTGLQSHQIEQGRGLLRRARKSRSETIRELAENIGVEDGSRLESSLDHYNRGASRWPPVDQVFSKSTKWVRPLHGPFYAVDCSLCVFMSTEAMGFVHGIATHAAASRL